MTLPAIRRYTSDTPTALNTAVAVSDDSTDEKIFTLFGNNAVIDVVNDPDPNDPRRYEIRLVKQGNETPVRFFSSSMSPESAGRIGVGPINMTPGQYQWRVFQRNGTLAAYSFIIKYAQPLD